MWPENCYITLTYNEENLPKDGSLCQRDFQLFIKKYRKYLSWKQKIPEKYARYKTKYHKIRYYYCGEYGENYGRPHFHAIIFNHNFPHQKLFKIVNGQPLFTAPALTRLWGKGYATIGTVTFESAAYVARYVMKKHYGADADEHYESINQETGEVIQLKPEYTAMSRASGIGASWYQKYKTDCYPKDFITLEGVKHRVPKSYERLYEAEDPEGLEAIKIRRSTAAQKHSENNTNSRLEVREKIQLLKLKLLKRSYESGES